MEKLSILLLLSEVLNSQNTWGPNCHADSHYNHSNDLSICIFSYMNLDAAEAAN